MLHAHACIEGPLAGVWRAGMDDGGYRMRVRPRVEEILAGEGVEADRYRGFLKVHPWALYKALEAADRYGLPELIQAQRHLYLTNWRLVSGQGPAPALLEQLVIGLLSGRRAAGALDDRSPGL